MDVLEGWGYDDGDPLLETDVSTEAGCSNACFEDVTCQAATLRLIGLQYHCTMHKSILVPYEDPEIIKSWSKSCPYEQGAQSE